MNKFDVYHYDSINKQWIQLDNVAYPLGIGDFLDERLDEAYITFYDRTEHYRSSTVFKIICFEGGAEQAPIYFVLDSDSVTEFPVGSRIFKHSAHLIEPTKLLEGVLCQTISFTNELGDSDEGIHESTLNYCIPTVFGSPVSNIDTALLDVNFGIKNIIKGSTQITLPTIEDVGAKFAKALNSVASFETYFMLYEGESKITVINGSETITTYTQDEEITLSPKTDLEIEYYLTMYYIVSNDPNPGTQYNVSSVLTFTPSIVGGIYPTLPYTITSMTNRCLMLAEPLFNKSVNGRIYPRFVFDTTYYYNRERVFPGSQAEYYDSIFADEITLSKATLREQLKSIGRLIHAEPRVKISEQVSTGWRRDLIYTVVYDKYGEINTATALIGKPYSYKALSQSINEYCTSIRTNASNLVNSLDYGVGVVSDPESGSNYSVRSLRAESTGARIEGSNAIAETANPIYKLIKVECGILSNDGTYALPPTDITPFVHEKAKYDLMSSYGNVYPNTKGLALYYVQGEPNIHGLFYRASVPLGAISNVFEYYSIVRILALCTGKTYNEISGYISTYREASLVFRVTYIPMYSTTLTHSKQLYEPGIDSFSQIYNQTENIIEAKYYGENIKGTAMKLGNVSEERTYMLPKRSALPKCGEIIDGYTIAAVNSEMLPMYVKCTVALSKDYNRINEYVGINSHKRVYEVSEREAYDRDILIHENVVFSTSNIESASGVMLSAPGHTLWMLRDVYKNDPKEITDVVAKSGGHTVNLPVISAAFGNAMVFTWKYKDNYSAGQSSVYVSGSGVSGQWGVETPYGDLYGRANLYEMHLFHGPLASRLSNDEPKKYPYLIPNLDGINVPDLSGSPISTANSGEYIMKKDSREKINTVNYEVEFRTTEKDLIIGSALASSNPLVTRITDSFYIYALKRPVNKFMRTISIDDVYLDGNGEPVILANLNEIGLKTSLGVSTNYPQNASRLVFPKSDFPGSCYWAITTELKQQPRGPFLHPDGTTESVTEWVGGDVLLAGLNEVKNDKPLYSDLYLSIQK